MFIAFGAAYLFASRGGATLRQWIGRGKLIDGAMESANPTVQGDARKGGARNP
jgi:hypothetical protein